MDKYAITIERTRKQTGFVFVEAASEKHAIEAVEKMFLEVSQSIDLSCDEDDDPDDQYEIISVGIISVGTM